MTLERNILDKLNLVHPRSLTENVLLNDVRLDEPRTSLTELRNAVRSLETKDQVVVVSSEDATRIKITLEGKARISE